MGERRVSDVERLEILVAYRLKVPLKEIAARYGVCLGYAQTLGRREGVRRDGRRRRWLKGIGAIKGL